MRHCPLPARLGSIWSSSWSARWYFSASALALAARGVEGFLVNSGRMRMAVGCMLDQAEIDAIACGHAIRQQVEQRLAASSLLPLDQAMHDALELLAWLVAEGRLDVRVAVPCDAQRRPMVADGIFHEKAGIVEDKTGERIAFNGSLNEAAAGWTLNWESLRVFASWREPERVDVEDGDFARIWAGRARRIITLDIPEAAKADLLRFPPQNDKPARLKARATEASVIEVMEPARRGAAIRPATCRMGRNRRRTDAAEWWLAGRRGDGSRDPVGAPGARV